MKGLAILYNTEKKWEQMAEVFRKSWAQHMDIPLQIIERPPPPQETKVYGLDANTHKLNAWLEHFDEDTIFCDCDMLVRGDISDGFQYVKNIGITKRTTLNRPFNAGVVFARHTEYSVKFMKKWVEINQQMFENKRLRMEYVQKTIPGMNQPALACLLEKGWEVDMLPEVYNMCDADRWKQGKMVHIKSESRNICFHDHRRFMKKEYQKSLHKTFWAYLGGKNTPRLLIEVQQAKRNAAFRKRRLTQSE